MTRARVADDVVAWVVGNTFAELMRGRVVCDRLPCRELVGAQGGMPFTQADLDAMARRRATPAVCVACGRFLTSVVAGPDPRD